MHNLCNFISDLKSPNLKHLKTLNYYLRVCKIKVTEGGNISDPSAYLEVYRDHR